MQLKVNLLIIIKKHKLDSTVGIENGKFFLDFDLFGSATTTGTNNNTGGLAGGNNNHMTFNRSASPNSMAGGPTRLVLDRCRKRSIFHPPIL